MKYDTITLKKANRKAIQHLKVDYFYNFFFNINIFKNLSGIIV